MPLPHVTLRKKDGEEDLQQQVIEELFNSSQYSNGGAGGGPGVFRKTQGSFRPATADPMAQTLERLRQSIQAQERYKEQADEKEEEEDGE